MNKKLKRGKTKKFVSMPMVNPNAAGIDVGDTMFSVQYLKAETQYS